MSWKPLTKESSWLNLRLFRLWVKQQVPWAQILEAGAAQCMQSPLAGIVQGTQSVLARDLPAPAQASDTPEARDK